MAKRNVAESLSNVARERPKGLLARFGSRAPQPETPSTSTLAEVALDRSEAFTLLRNYEETGQGWFWSSDAEGCIQYLSASVAERLGMAVAPQGKPFTALFAAPERGEERQRTLPFLRNRPVVAACRGVG